MVKTNLQQSVEVISGFLQTVSVPPRLAVLLTIGSGEACVCHLEAALGYRQAYISQHLMALREAGILESRREGRFIYYRLVDPRYLELIVMASEVLEAPVDIQPISLFKCECPNCMEIK